MVVPESTANPDTPAKTGALVEMAVTEPTVCVDLRETKATLDTKVFLEFRACVAPKVCKATLVL